MEVQSQLKENKMVEKTWLIKGVVPVKCPYCGNKFQYHTNKLVAETFFVQDIFIFCDIETGGCDEKFGISVRLEPMVKDTYQLVNAN
jgi:hypothetical protein